MTGRISRESQRGSRTFHLFEVMMAVGVILLAVAGWWGYARYYQDRMPPEQPIPFSHRVHVNDKQIGCLVCHDSAAWSGRAGIPPLQTCMLCHDRVAIHYPPIAKLREHYFNNVPVQWVRVNWVNEFVYFPHFMHLQAGIDCGTCHGDVRMMDRVETVHPFQMGFCIECHRENGATTDCFTCHR